MAGPEHGDTPADKLREAADDAGVDSGVDASDVPPDSAGYSAPPLDSSDSS